MYFAVLLLILLFLQPSKASQQPELPSLAKLASCYYPPDHEPGKQDPSAAYYNHVKVLLRNRKTDLRVLFDCNLNEEKLRFGSELPSSYAGIYYEALHYTLSKDTGKSTVQQASPAESGYLYYKTTTLIRSVEPVPARPSLRNISDIEQFDDDGVSTAAAVSPLPKAHVYVAHSAHTADPPKGDGEEAFPSDEYFPKSTTDIPKERSFYKHRAPHSSTRLSLAGLIERRENMSKLRPTVSECQPPRGRELDKLKSKNIVSRLFDCICNFHQSLSKQWESLVVGQNGILMRRATSELAMQPTNDAFYHEHKCYAVAAYAYEIYSDRNRLSMSQFDSCSTYHYEKTFNAYNRYLFDKPAEPTAEAIYEKSKSSKWHRLIQDRDFAVYLRRIRTLSFDPSAFKTIDASKNLYRTTREYFGLAAGQDVILNEMRIYQEKADPQFCYADAVMHIYRMSKDEGYLGYFYDENKQILRILLLPDKRQIVPWIDVVSHVSTGTVF